MLPDFPVHPTQAALKCVENNCSQTIHEYAQYYNVDAGFNFDYRCLVELLISLSVPEPMSS